MVSMLTLATIVSMALVTYLTRIGGYLLLGGRQVSPRTKAVMEAAPGCVLISVIVPHFAADDPADLLAIAITLIAAIRLPVLATVLIGIVAAGTLRFLFS